MRIQVWPARILGRRLNSQTNPSRFSSNRASTNSSECEDLFKVQDLISEDERMVQYGDIICMPFTLVLESQRDHSVGRAFCRE